MAPSAIFREILSAALLIWDVRLNTTSFGKLLVIKQMSSAYLIESF
jgi:hypothetical protein